ncbi:ribonuclease HII [PVC group bacterium]|nr:ribonuclease HII [PVC group bacterium]
MFYLRSLGKQSKFLPFEQDIRLKQSKTRIAGVDEAGRGPWAGPVVAAVVILPEEPTFLYQDLRDSKQMTPRARSRMYDLISEKAVDFGIALVSAADIDRMNILEATKKAMVAAVLQLDKSPDHLLIDGNQKIFMNISQDTIVKGDAQCCSIAAASVMAKVFRDRVMIEFDQKYPQYKFYRHKGYGTKMHHEILMDIGPCPIHRRSFLPIKKLIQFKSECAYES